MTPYIFVISLPGSSERKRSIAARLDSESLKFSWLDGVDGRALDESNVSLVCDSARAEREIGRQLSRGEIGCALSHQKVYRAMLDRKLDLALVLEDDAALSTNFCAELKAVCTTVRWDECDVVLLSHIHKYTDWGAQRVAAQTRLVRPIVAYNGNGYLVTRRGAAKLLDCLYPVHRPADCWSYLMKATALQIKGVVPYLVNHSALGQNSVIGHDMRGARALKSNPLPKKLKKMFYDKFIYQLIVKPALRIRKQPETW